MATYRTYCFVHECRTGYSNTREVPYLYPVPSNILQRMLWNQSVKRLEREMDVGDVVCHKHFEAKDKRYYKNCGNGMIRTCTHPNILRTAVPILALPAQFLNDSEDTSDLSNRYPDELTDITEYNFIDYYEEYLSNLRVLPATDPTISVTNYISSSAIVPNKEELDAMLIEKEIIAVGGKKLKTHDFTKILMLGYQHTLRD